MAPFILNPRLTLTRKPGNKVVVDVTYTVFFSKFDRHLVGLGMNFRERIEIIGVDPAGSTTGTVLAQFFPDLIPVTDGEQQLEISRHRFMPVDRRVLDEDTSPVASPDTLPDEIRCRILIDAVDLPPITTEVFTNQAVLGMTQSLHHVQSESSD